MLEIVRPNIWKYDKYGTSLVPPLAYSPRVFQFMLKLLKETKQWTIRVDSAKLTKMLFIFHSIMR